MHRERAANVRDGDVHRPGVLVGEGQRPGLHPEVPGSVQAQATEVDAEGGEEVLSSIERGEHIEAFVSHSLFIFILRGGPIGPLLEDMKHEIQNSVHQFYDKENDIETEIVFLMIFNLNIHQYEYLATNDDKAKCTVALPNIQRA